MVAATVRLLQAMARPVRTIAATAVVEAGITGRGVSELGTVASQAGLCRTVSANRTGAISSVPKSRRMRGFHAAAAIRGAKAHRRQFGSIGPRSGTARPFPLWRQDAARLRCPSIRSCNHPRGERLMRCDRAGARAPRRRGRSSSAAMARRVGYGVGGGGGGFGGLGGGGFGGLNGSMTTFPSVCAVGEPCSIASAQPSGKGERLEARRARIPIAGPRARWRSRDAPPKPLSPRPSLPSRDHDEEDAARRGEQHEAAGSGDEFEPVHQRDERQGRLRRADPSRVELVTSHLGGGVRCDQTSRNSGHGDDRPGSPSSGPRPDPGLSPATAPSGLHGPSRHVNFGTRTSDPIPGLIIWRRVGCRNF
jgi:hypothetical protein